MTASSGFWRLFARPATLLMLFPLFMAGVLPAIMMDQRVANTLSDALASGDPSSALLQYALLLAISLGAAVGLLAASASLELQATDMAWVLPGLPRALAGGIMTLALLVAAISGLLAARAATAAMGLAAAALAIAAVMIVVVATDAAQRPAVRIALFATLAAALLRPDEYASLVAAQPTLVGLGALGVAALLLPQHVSRSIARRRPFTASQFVTGARGMQLFWSARGRDGRAWTLPAHTARMRDWLRAGLYELSGTIRGGPLGLLAGLVLLALLAHVFSPAVLMVVTFSLTYNGLQLRGGLGYPISRLHRGRLQYAGNLIDAVAVTVIVSATLLLLRAAGVPGAMSAHTATIGEYGVSLGACFALTPILQWARVRGPMLMDSQKQLGRYIAYPLTFMIGVIAIASIVARVDVFQAADRQLALVIALAVAGQVIHFVLIRRFFATRDLVASSDR